MSRLQNLNASLYEDAHSNEGKHIMQCIGDCSYELNKIIDLANQDDIDEDGLEEFKLATQNLEIRSAALNSWAEELTTDDWIAEEGEEEF